ncbi:hypothetical protein J7S95_19555 [Providencia stuartii]|uniref:hypothetical protein n=1 Tax=Providencia stuartii TaxID=588 RepID=UPI001B541B2A|nr:hypothetical protein [Providencia stuartii]MBQ0458886.1 hypothetical protein [Providencia stuartii]MBQ0458893.1 hypothetical protein [Providencia stuartii]
MINIELINFYLTTFINVFIVFPSLIYLYCFMRKKEKEKEQEMNFLKLINIMNSKFKNREYHPIDGLSFNLYQLIIENKNLFKNEKEEIDFFKNNFSQFFKKDVGSDEIAGRIVVNYKDGSGDYCLILKKDILYHHIYNYFVFAFEKRAYGLKRGYL